MKVLFGVLCLIAGLLYIGQVISVVNFNLAQRLGLQESPDHADPISSSAELWAARWDLLWLWTLPAAGALMLIDQWLWPYAAMIGGAAFFDAGGREAAKVLGLKQAGVGVGSRRELRVIIATFVFLGAAGLFAIGFGLSEVI